MRKRNRVGASLIVNNATQKFVDGENNFAESNWVHPQQRNLYCSRKFGVSLFALMAVILSVSSDCMTVSLCTALLSPSYGGHASRTKLVHKQGPSHIVTTSPRASQTSTSTTPMITSSSFQHHLPVSSQSKSIALHVSFSGWDDVVFQAESLANSWATVSLQSSGSGSSSLWAAVPVMYGAGLLTSFSPCVWGLLPLTISYISAAAQERRDQQTLLPTVAFCLGLATVFCTLGIAAVSIGSVFGATAASDDSVMASTASMILPLLSNSICFLMGLKLLDLIDLPLTSFSLPSPMKTSRGTQGGPILLDASGRTIEEEAVEQTGEGNALFRTFFLGGSSALVASPCATPVLTSILAFVANSEATHGASMTGALLLFFYTLGYSTPLFIVAATGGQALVRMKQQQKVNDGNIWSWSTLPSRLSPWVTPATGGILLYLGTTGLLTTLLGDPSLVGLTILE
jgi:cytochrome c-type biogenesis protein